MTIVIRVESNWKGTPSSPDWTAQVGQSTILTGPNGGGKSRVIEAIQLALTGSVSNYLGRKSVKDSKMLWRSKAKGKGALYIELTLSDGGTIRWEQSRSNGKPKWLLDGEAFSGLSYASLIVSDVRDNLFGSPATAEKWLSTQLGITTEEIMATLSQQAEDHPYVWSLVQPFANAGPTPAALVQSLQKRARASKAEAETAQTLVEEMQHASGPTVTDAELQAAREKVSSLESQGREAFNRCEDSQLLASLEGAERTLSAELDSLPAPNPQAVAGLATARSIVLMLERVLLHYPQNTLCPCCHKELDSGVASLHKRGKELTEYIASAQEAASILERRQFIKAKIGPIQNQASALVERNPGIRSVEQTQLDVESIQRQLGEAQTHLDELQRRRVSTQAPSMAQATVNRASEAHAGYKEAAKMVETIITKSVTEAVDEFNVALCKVYPEHLGTPVLSLRPQVSIGVERNGVVGAPSGGEESLLLLAIATVVSYLKGVERLNMLVMEDKSIDTYTLLSIIDNWRGCEYAQVFVPTTHKVEGEVEGWEVVDCWTKENDWDNVAVLPALQRPPSPQAPRV